MQISLGEWHAIGNVGSDAEHRLVLPSPPAGPGIYRFRLLGTDPSVYVGETADLPRCLEGFETPDPSQPTNRSLNDEILDALRDDQHIPVEICVVAEVEVGTCREALDLTIKSHRLLAEEAALVEARAAGFGRVENVGG